MSLIRGFLYRFFSKERNCDSKELFLKYVNLSVKWTIELFDDNLIQLMAEK